MCWTLSFWTVASLMFARTCWLQVPRRTLYSIIRDMCDCRVSRIRLTLRMPLVCMRISPIRLDLLSTAFCVLDKTPHRERWAWGLSLSFAITISNKIYFLITFTCVTVCSKEAPYVFIHEGRYCLELRAPAGVHRWEVCQGEGTARKLGFYHLYGEFLHTYPSSCFLFWVEGRN